MERIYLDNSATTQTNPEVVKVMVEYMTNKYGNPSSLHQFGQDSKYGLDEAREQVAKVINANIDEIFFTSGGTESDNLAIRGVINANLKKLENGQTLHIITSDYEHPAVGKTCKYLAEKTYGRKQIEVTYLKPDKNGYIYPEQVKEAIKPETVLVSIMHINNEIGTINDIKTIGKICRERKITFHTDAVQSFTKELIDVKKMDIDLLSASAHKIYGPKGVGMLYVRKRTKIEPIMYGGAQENEVRMGTENLPGIIGFGKACELSEDAAEYLPKFKEMKFKLLEMIKKEIPDVILNGQLENNYFGVLNIRFNGVEGEALALSLDMEGIAISTGSACSSGSVNPSKALISIGLTPEQAHSSIRISFGKNNTMAEIEKTGEAIIRIVKRLRAMSNY